MAKKLIVRVIRTYHIEVEPEYGDSEETICKKGLKNLKDNAKPEGETVIILPEGSKT